MPRGQEGEHQCLKRKKTVQVPDQKNSEERLRKRLRRPKRRMRNENRWWRAGAIAALVLIAVAILVSGHRRHHYHRPPSEVAATAPMGPMPGLYGGILDPDHGMGPAGWGRQGHPHS
jgi:hypothetical protein